MNPAHSAAMSARPAGRRHTGERDLGFLGGGTPLLLQNATHGVFIAADEGHGTPLTAPAVHDDPLSIIERQRPAVVGLAFGVVMGPPVEVALECTASRIEYQPRSASVMSTARRTIHTLVTSRRYHAPRGESR